MSFFNVHEYQRNVSVLEVISSNKMSLNNIWIN